MDNGKPDEFSAKVISLGRVTIKEEMRIMHDIKKGDIVTIKILDVQHKPKEGC